MKPLKTNQPSSYCNIKTRQDTAAGLHVKLTLALFASSCLAWFYSSVLIARPSSTSKFQVSVEITNPTNIYNTHKLKLMGETGSILRWNPIK